MGNNSWEKATASLCQKSNDVCRCLPLENNRIAVKVLTTSNVISTIYPNVEAADFSKKILNFHHPAWRHIPESTIHAESRHWDTKVHFSYKGPFESVQVTTTETTWRWHVWCAATCCRLDNMQTVLLVHVLLCLKTELLVTRCTLHTSLQLMIQPEHCISFSIPYWLYWLYFVRGDLGIADRGAVEELWNATVSVVMSVCLSLHMEELDCHRTDFYEISYFRNSRKSL